MIITRPREFSRLIENLKSVGAKTVFLVGCGQCASVARTGGEPEVLAAAELLEQAGYVVAGYTIGEVACHSGGTRLAVRKNADAVNKADAVIVYSCGAGVQTVADAIAVPVFPALDSAFLGNVIRHGEFEERCQTCGDCVLDKTAGICPVTQCPKGLLNGPCGGMWDGMCEVLEDRQCIHVRIKRKLAEQGRSKTASLTPKNYGVKIKPGRIDLRADKKRADAAKKAGE